MVQAHKEASKASLHETPVNILWILQLSEMYAWVSELKYGKGNQVLAIFLMLMGFMMISCQHLEMVSITKQRNLITMNNYHEAVIRGIVNVKFKVSDLKFKGQALQ